MWWSKIPSPVTKIVVVPDIELHEICVSNNQIRVRSNTKLDGGWLYDKMKIGWNNNH